MSQIAPLLSRPSAWLNSPGSHGSVVISSRVRLARNVDGFAFQRKLSKVRQQELVVQLDHALEKSLPWSSHPEYGYLTACPTNVGTGLRASVMLHLPALVETGEFKQVMRSLGKLHMTVRGLHGEGSEPSGHFYQVSNQRALGQSEQQIVDHLNETVERIVAYEQLAREALLTKGRLKLEDKVHRA